MNYVPISCDKQTRASIRQLAVVESLKRNCVAARRSSEVGESPPQVAVAIENGFGFVGQPPARNIRCMERFSGHGILCYPAHGSSAVSGLTDQATVSFTGKWPRLLAGNVYFGPRPPPSSGAMGTVNFQPPLTFPIGRLRRHRVMAAPPLTHPIVNRDRLV